MLLHLLTSFDASNRLETFEIIPRFLPSLTKVHRNPACYTLHNLLSQRNIVRITWL